jgi:hypothetical protein
MRRISHHASARPDVFGEVGVSGLVGVDIVPLLSAADVTITRSDKQTPSPGITLVELLQLDAVHAPERRT